MRTRVLWLTKGLGRGGAELLLLRSLAHVDRTRYDVEVAYILPRKNALVSDFAALGISVHCLGTRTRTTRPLWMLRLHELLRDGQFDIVHTHAPLPAAVARVICRRRPPRFVHTEHNVWSRYRRPTRLANRVTFGRNEAVITVSAAVASSIGTRAAGPTVEVVLHGPDMHASGSRTEARTRLGLDANASVIGSVGNFTPKKNQALLLRAVARLVPAHPTLRLVLIGTGPEEVALRRLAAQLSIGEAVLFTGVRKDVADLLPAFDAFALSSRHEGLPIALLEAMASGLAVVATAVGGVPEVVTDEHDGLLVPCDDEGALAAALARVLGDPVLNMRLGEAGRSTAARFDLATAVQQIEAVYDRAMAQ